MSPNGRGGLRGAMAWAAIRHRPFQAVVLVLLSALLTAVAVFGPLYARALENGIFVDAFDRDSVVKSGVVDTQNWSNDLRPERSDAVKAVPVDVAAVVEPGTVITSGRANVMVSARRGGTVVETTAYAPDQGCAKLTITAGRCPVAHNEVMVSTQEAKVEGWRVGDRVKPSARGAAPPEAGPPRIVGTFDQVRDERYWFGSRAGRWGYCLPCSWCRSQPLSAGSFCATGTW